MHSIYSTSALLGFIASSLVAAAPVTGTRAAGASTATLDPLYYAIPAPTAGGNGREYAEDSSPTTGRVITVGYTVSPIPTEVHSNGNKFRFPLSNGFPNPNGAAVNDIQRIAGGTLPNGGGGNAPSNDAITSLKLIAFNELFEVAFFTDLLRNITEKVPGYRVKDATALNVDLDDLIITLATVQAQEELHELNANGALMKFNAGPIQPCKYVFGVNNLRDAIATAATFTDVVLGTLQDVANDLGLSGDIGLIRGISSVIGQEGEQNGFYRLFQGKRPSAQPFLTASARQFAFSALNQNFVVPGTCPNLDTIDLPIFEPLKQIGAPAKAKDSTLTFQIRPNGDVNLNDLSLVLINGQNQPIVQRFRNVKKMKHGVIQFDAAFPFDSNLLFGLTIAVVTNTHKGLTDVDKVADATVFGPALIEVN